MARDVAAEVRDFYEHYPYPPAVDNLDRYRPQQADTHRRRAEYHLLWPDRPFRDDFSILVAGCGTWQAAKYALRWPAARVVGVDVSAASIESTARLQRQHRLTNLDVRQLPIARLHELERRFDLIVCTGVLHHLVDPDAGLAALRDVLAPGGAMHLMVYAPYGRAGIYMLQEFCRRLGLTATDRDIRDLVAALRLLPAGHPLATLLLHAPDFRDTASLADALLHPQDRAYSVPQVLRLVDDAGLVFGRWLRQAPYSVRCGVVATLPLAARLARLPLPEQHAAVELFRGTMVKHSVVAHRADRAADPVSFATDAWRDYVPIRMPDTMCVQEGLPAGVAGVLINRTHTFTDLLLPLSADEKRSFDAIDGVARAGDLGAPREFIERLWWQDQVVFETRRPDPN